MVDWPERRIAARGSKICVVRVAASFAVLVGRNSISKAGRLKSAADVAAEVLRESSNPAVGYGDAGLLHQIAERLGMEHEGPLTEKKVLDRIDRSCSGVLVKRFEAFPSRGRGRVRRYWLPELAPQRA